MNDQTLTRKSKFLSLVLRHKPEKIGLTLSEQGWVSVDDLLAALAKHGKGMSRDVLVSVVETNDKKRFAFSEDGLQIRASQGHSIQVDLDLKPQTPPAILYHGTATRSIASIREKGLVKGKRQHVHLSADPSTAQRVGQRHGKPVVLTIDAAAMSADGVAFYLSANGVWLTDSVKSLYLSGWPE